jgi:folate-binding protein YgfZ
MIEILKDRALIHIVGPDSGKFLQGMTTNDVIKKNYSYNYLLTNQGKYLFDFFVYQQSAESYFLDINKTSLDIFLKRLNMYKLRSNLDIKDVSLDYNIVYSKSQIESDVEFSLQDTRYKALGYRSMMKTEKIKLLNKLVDNLYISDKYKYTIIDGYLDLVYDRSIPVEYGAEELNAIEYNKGCYVGQEVISRVKYQGVVRKKIFKLQFGTEFAVKEQEAKITDLDGDKLGIVCSNYKNQAIGLLREEKFLGLKQKVAMIENQLVNIEIPPWRN